MFDDDGRKRHLSFEEVQADLVADRPGEPNAPNNEGRVSDDTIETGANDKLVDDLPARVAPTDNANAFASFYGLFMPDLVRFLVWQGATLVDSLDAAQEAMLEAYRHWSSINQPRAWIRRVASRIWMRRMAQPELQLTENLHEHMLLNPNLDVEAWEQRHDVLRALRHLPPRQRQVLAWTLDGFTPAEIAAQLGLTSETIRANLFLARKTIQKHMGHAGGPNDR